MPIPKAIADATFTISGVPIKCYVLDDGRRIIDTDDFAVLMDRMADSSATIDGGDLDEFTKWLKE